MGNGTAGADVVTVDRWGNIYIANKSTGSTGAAMVAAIYAGAPSAVTGPANPLYGMLNAIYPGLGAPSQNFTYILSGNGATAPSVVTTPITSWVIGAPNTSLGGTAVGLSHGAIQGIAVDGAGNVYFTDTSKLFVWRIDAVNGETAIVAGGGSKYSLASLSFPTTQKCENNATIYASSNLGDGCDTTAIYMYGGNYGVAVGPAGDVYFTQGAANVLDKLSIGTNFAATAVGASSVAQRIRIHFYAGNLYAATGTFAIAGISATEFAFSVTPTPLSICAKNADASFDCVVTVTFKPVGTGVRQAQLIATDASGVAHSFPLSGFGTGAQLTFDAGIGTNLATGLSTAAGVAVDGAGTVYATDSATGSLYRTKAGTTAAFAASALLSKPQQVGVDAAGNVYIADSGNNRIAVVTPQGAVSTLALQLKTLGALSAPQGVAVDRFGNIYVADTGNARILLQPANGAYTTQTVATGSVTLSKPTALAVDSAGNLYAVDAGLDEVVEFPQAQQGLNAVEASPAGAAPVVYKSNAMTSPQGVVVDPAGSVYVSDNVANTVFVFAAGSSTPVTLIPTGLSAPASSLSAPAGLAFDTASNLYIADTGNSRVYEEYRGSQTLAMGQVGIGTTSPLYPVEVGSYGTVATTLKGFAISSPFTSVNTGSAECGATTQLGIGGYCSAEVSYTPGSTPGAVSGTLQATDNALSSPQTITITATAVVQQAQTISWTLPSPVTYGVAPITLGATASSGLTVTYTITSGSQYGSIKGNVLTVTGAGTIVIQAAQAGAPAYKPATTVSQTLVVNKATAVFTAANVVGGTGVIPPLTYTASGFVNGDTQATATTGAPAETTTATASSIAGTYPINLSVGTLAAANYTFSFVSGTLTLQGTGQTINFTALPTSVTYGVAPIPLVATATSGLPVSFAVTGPATLSGTTVTITGAGTVVVTATQAGSTPVYQPYAPAQPVVQMITVNPAPLTVTANSASRIYGIANATFTGSVAGAQNGDVFTEVFATSATSSSNVGTYPITPSVTGANPANYTITVVAGTLTITQAPTTIVLVPTPNPVLVNGTVTLTATLTIPGGTPTGTFTFFANGLSLGSATYTVNGTTVTAVKTNTPNNASMTYTVSYGSDPNLGNSTSSAVTVPVQSPTTAGLTSTNMTPGTGQSFTLQATVVATLAGAVAPTGTVTFAGVQNGVTTTLGTAAVSAAGLANLKVTYTTPGVLALTATYSGDSLHASSVATIIQISNNSNTIANVIPVVVGTPTFEISLTPINFGLNVFVNASNAAPYVTPAPPAVCTAVPSGTASNDVKFYAIPYCLTTSNSVTATAGSVIQQIIDIQSFFGLADNVTMSCSGLPQNASCLFSPPVTPLTATASGQQVAVSINTVRIIEGENRPGAPFGRSRPVAWAVLLLGSLGLLGAGRRFRSSLAGRVLMLVAVLTLGGVATLGVSGCANLNGSAKAVAGVYPVVITAADGTVTQTVTVNLTLQ